jgi:hypothetical protein
MASVKVTVVVSPAFKTGTQDGHKAMFGFYKAFKALSGGLVRSETCTLCKSVLPLRILPVHGLEPPVGKGGLTCLHAASGRFNEY